MDFRQLRYFIAVMEAGSITDAARALHVVQPAVSQRLADLERALGVQLLVRTRQGVSPTAAGNELYARGRSILKQVSVAAHATRERGGIVGGRVSIGLLHSLSRCLAVPLFKALQERVPAVTPEIVVDYSDQLVQRVNATTLDLTLRVLKAGEVAAGCKPLMTESLWLVGSQRLLRGKPAEITIADVAGVPLLVSPTQPIHAELKILAQEAGVDIPIVGSIESALAIDDLCRSGVAATFLSEMTARALLGQTGRKLTMARLTGFDRTIGTYVHPDIPMTSSIQSCLSLLAEVLQQTRERLLATRT